jgi:ABC-2 type transport system ATP-binding protein
MDVMIAMRGVGKTYRPRGRPAVAAVHNLELTVAAGQAVAVLGAPGAGKTTVIKLLGGLARPTAGTIVLGGYDLARERAAARGHVGLPAAEPALPSGRRSAQEYLLRAGRARGLREAVLGARVETLLHETNLWAYRHDDARALSPGQRQTLALASALVADPPIVLLDEPARDLAGAEARAHLAALRAVTRGKTMVLATSRAAVACDLCERIAVLSHGRLAGERTRGELLDLFRRDRYSIRVKGHLGAAWSEWFDSLAVVNEEGGEAVISGPIADQSALHGVLARIHALNLPLLSLSRAEPSMDDVFSQLYGHA